MNVVYCKYCEKDHPDTKEFWYYQRGYRTGCKEKLKDAAKARHHRLKHTEEYASYCAENRKKFLKKNPDYHREWYANRLEEQKKADRKRALDRWHTLYKSDLTFKLRSVLRCRLYKAVKGIVKETSHVKDLGCSIEVLITHLESRFKDGMTWDNYGSAWHIDHIIPFGNKDLSDKELLLSLTHYTNLQPLWAQENYSKGAKEP